MLIDKQLCNKRALSDFYFSVYQSKNIQMNQIHIKKNFRIKYHDFHCRVVSGGWGGGGWGGGGGGGDIPQGIRSAGPKIGPGPYTL